MDKIFPLISIITVVYNGEKHLEQTINSVLNQAYPHIEYIIVDGGSTDKTIPIIKKYENKISKWISEPDRGIYDAMNKGIALASGQYIGMINADDWYESDAVERVVEVIRENPKVDIVHGKLNFINLYTGKSFILTPKVSLHNLLWKGMSVYHPTMFVKKSVYSIYKYNVDYRIKSDFKFIYQTIKDGKSYIATDSIIASFRSGGASNDILVSFLETIVIKKEVGVGLFLNIASSINQLLLHLAHRSKQHFQHFLLQKNTKTDH